MPGRNCWRIERADRVGFLIDGEAYFAAVRDALARARRSFFIIGWDIDSRMELVPGGARDGFPEPLGGERRDHYANTKFWRSPPCRLRHPE